MINRYEFYNKFKDFLCFIKVDENCNLRCSFCYQGEKKQLVMDTQEKIDNCLFNLDFAIERFLQIKSKEQYEFAKLNICFFGGEPTLNPGAIKQICKHLKEKYSEDIRKNFNITMTSNGIIYSEEIIRAIADVSVNPVGIMISSDNSKEVYDKNRKLVGSDKSGFEIVQNNIKKYRKLISEINGFNSDELVTVATVLADAEQLRNNPLLIQENYKNVMRRGKLLYDLSHQETNYIEEAKKFLLVAYSNLIDKCTKENKAKGLDEILNCVFEFKGKGEFSECNSIFAIDANGDVNWCNKHRYFEDEILPQEEMRKMAIFNKDTDNSHFKCVVNKLAGGAVAKDVIRPQLWERMVALFDPNVPVCKLNISDSLEQSKALYNFIKYIVGSTMFEEKKVYIKNPILEITKLCEEENIKIVNQPLNNDFENTFYIDENGDLFFDETLSNDNQNILTNIYEKHFMWFHTPTLLNSINEFYKSSILNLKRGE